MMLFVCLTSAIEYEHNAPELEAYLEQIAQGDLAAMSSLYTATSAAVYGFSLSILKDVEDAKDVLQDTYLRIHGAAAGYRPRGKPMAWILTIAKNLARMKLREGGRRVWLNDDQWERTFGENPHATTEDRMLLTSAMQLLADMERQIVMLHAVAGLKHREIAELLQTPLSTVLSKYHRAIQKLRRGMRDENP